MKKERVTKVLVLGGLALALMFGICDSIVNARGKNPFGYNVNPSKQMAGKNPFGFAKLLPLNQLVK